jgi:hypothetical protein
MPETVTATGAAKEKTMTVEQAANGSDAMQSGCPSPFLCRYGPQEGNDEERIFRYLKGHGFVTRDEFNRALTLVNESLKDIGKALEGHGKALDLLATHTKAITTESGSTGWAPF